MENPVFPVTRAKAKEQGIEYTSEMNKNALFPSRLRELRKEKGVSQADIAKVLGVSKSTVGLWETGDTQPDAESIYNMANYYNVNADYLLRRSDVKSRKVDLQTTQQTTGLSEEAIKVLHSMTEHDIIPGVAKYKPGAYQRGVLDAVNLLLTSEIGRALLLDVYSYAIAEYDKFSCVVNGETVELDSVFLNSGGVQLWELVAADMNDSMIADIQSDLHDLKKEVRESK